MTQPRHVRPGQVVFVTRRTHGRRFRLRPCRETEELFQYLLAALAPRFGIGVWSAVLMSNHYHFGLTDHEGRLPQFLQLFDSLLARSVNALQGERDSLWSGDKPHIAIIADEAALYAKIGYIAANPVSARLVEHGRQWPSVRINPQDYGRPQTFRRPKAFFSERGTLPEEATLALEIPPLAAHRTMGEFIRRACDAIAAAESEARQANAGKPYLGAARCRGIDPMSRPMTPEPGGQRHVGRVIATDPASRAEVEEALDWTRSWPRTRSPALSSAAATVTPAGRPGRGIASSSTAAHAMGAAPGLSDRACAGRSAPATDLPVPRSPGRAEVRPDIEFT